jgi:hypothetical protein
MHRNAKVSCRLDQFRIPGGCRTRDEQVDHRPVGGENFADRLWPLDQERSGTRAIFALQQSTGPGYATRLAGEQLGAGFGPIAGQAAATLGSAARATSTSAANAAGSLTANSASIRRSTSISASLRPWMSRL